jgi:hypothetical protein
MKTNLNLFLLTAALLLRGSLELLAQTGGAVTFTSAFYSAFEGSCVVVYLPQSPPRRAGSVMLQIVGGTATEGADFRLSTKVVTFALWLTNDCFTVVVLADGVPEGSETIKLGLSDPTGGSTLGTPSRTTITLKEPALRFGSTPISVSEISMSESAAPMPIAVRRDTADALGLQ